MKIISQQDEQATKDLLLGRQIIAAEQGSFAMPKDKWGYEQDEAVARLTLDDGTKILVVPNEGCGGCSAGRYDVAHLATVENAITDVRLALKDESDQDGEGPKSYRIYVMAGNEEINAVQVDGDDGNGYYGTGYELFVVQDANT